MDTSQSTGMEAKKNSIESMTKEDLINKYKGLLTIAKQAKKAKDEFAEENQKLKEKLTNCETQREADKQSLLTMKEMLEEFTRNKLEMTSELSELRGKNKLLMDERVNMEQLAIENEALRRQLDRVTEDNESLLTDIDKMELQLKQVNVLGMEQKKHLDLLELEVEKLKEYEVASKELECKLQDLLHANNSLQESYDISQTESQALAVKYQSLKDINSEQRTKFNGLKDRFIEVHKKLKQLQDCKRILVESHHEYADSISRWQLEIMHASKQLCAHIQTLTKENGELKKEIQTASGDVSVALPQLPTLIEYCEKALVEYRRQNEVIVELRKENEELKSKVDAGVQNKDEVDSATQSVERIGHLKAENAKLQKESVESQIEKVQLLTKDNCCLREEIASYDEEVKSLRAENARLKNESEKANLKSVEDAKLLMEENVRLCEVIENAKLEAEKTVRQLTEENARWKEQVELAQLSVDTSLSKINQVDEEVHRLRTANAKLEEEASEAILSAGEVDHLKAQTEKLKQEAATTVGEVNRLKTENTKLEQEAALRIDEVNHLRAENVRLEEEIVKRRLEATEEFSRLRTVLEEETDKSKTIANEEVYQMRASNVKLGEDLANLKTITDEQIKHLKSENEKLAEEAAKARLNASECLTVEIERLKNANQGLKDELLAIGTASSIVASHLPILIDCCDRALLEHEQSEAFTVQKVNVNLNEAVAAGNFNTELDSLKSENSRLKKELSKANDTIQLCEELQTKLEKQERENTDLLNEMRELNEALKGRGDVISRQQAKHQELVSEVKKTSTALAKFEADLSAKDALLREKEVKITKISEDNHAALQEVNRLQNICREYESRIKTLSDEIAAMRSQLENHETQSEVLSSSTISRAEELARLREVDESFEEKYNKLRSLAVKLKKKAHEQSLHIADLDKQAADNKSKAIETSEKITSLETERESLQKELKTCKTQIESLKTEVDKLKTSKKQSNVLTLEIEAFEKSLNETSAKLTAKIAECDLMRETLQTKESAIEVMKKEIKILEDSQEGEKVHSVDLKKQIDKLQAQLKDAIHGRQEVSEKLDESQAEKQSLQADFDEVNGRLSTIADERDAERTALLKEKESLLHTINSLEDELNTCNNRITLAEQSYQDLQQEYSNYKVKAQSVLRQNQTKESSKERELEEELTLLKNEHKELHKRFQSFEEKSQANEKVIEELQEENRRLQNRSSELANIISDLRTHTDLLSQENRKQLDTYQETLKGHRLQIEALNECHVEQMQDLQAKYDRHVAELKATHKKDSETMPYKPLEKLDYILMEREDAEGSEAETANTPKYLPSARRSTHDLIPLDELLSSPTVDSTYTVLERRRSISPSIELQETKERLIKQESRVRHLTSLLAESEQDLARLTQLNEMLKEEVRRQERTVEREKHMHNSEYLKNVVLKFVSLNNGDERSRLVPVLNTILKLSPSETEMLQNVAKGKAPDNNNRTWGSFLPHWGGAS